MESVFWHQVGPSMWLLAVPLQAHHDKSKTGAFNVSSELHEAVDVAGH